MLNREKFKYIHQKYPWFLLCVPNNIGTYDIISWDGEFDEHKTYYISAGVEREPKSLSSMRAEPILVFHKIFEDGNECQSIDIWNNDMNHYLKSININIDGEIKPCAIFENGISHIMLIGDDTKKIDEYNIINQYFDTESNNDFININNIKGNDYSKITCPNCGEIGAIIINENDFNKKLVYCEICDTLTELKNND